MTTSTANLSPGTLTNLCALGADAAVQATNTATVTLKGNASYILLRVRINKNDDTDVPTVQGSGTLVVTVVDSGSTTILTTAALKGWFNTVTVASIPTDYVFAFPVYALGGGGSVAPLVGESIGIFTVVSTVASGDDTFNYQIDAIAVPDGDPNVNLFSRQTNGPVSITAAGSEGYVGP